MASQPETNRSTKLVLWVSGIVTLILLVLAVRYLTRERVAVRVGNVNYGNIVKTSSTNGKVELTDEFQAHAQGPGVVQQIYVNIDDQVKTGQLLIRMDDAEARARLATAQANLQSARNTQADITHGGTQDERNTNNSELARAQLQLQQDQALLQTRLALQQKGAASAAEVTEVRQRIQADQNSLHTAQQHLNSRYDERDLTGAQARIGDAQAAVDAAQASLANVLIHSPIAGTVYSLPVAKYDYVAGGDDLIYVANLNKKRVIAYFDEPEVGNLAAGQAVTIVWEAKRGLVWHGHVTVPPTTIIGYGTRNVGECLIEVDDATSELLPNTNVTVEVTTGQRTHVLTVPREAVHTDNNQQYVYRVLHGKLARTPVTVGFYNQISEEIVSGLSDGDTIVLNSATPGRELSDGLDVRAVP